MGYGCLPHGLKPTTVESVIFRLTRALFGSNQGVIIHAYDSIYLFLISLANSCPFLHYSYQECTYPFKVSYNRSLDLKNFEMADFYAGLQVLANHLPGNIRESVNKNIRVTYFCEYISIRFTLVAVVGNSLLNK